MNRATTIAEKWDGTEVLLFGRKVPSHEQFLEYNRLRVLHPRVHSDYKEVTTQEEHGEPKSISFSKPESKTPGLRTDGPTLLQFTLNGGNADDYPQPGFAVRVDNELDQKLLNERDNQSKNKTKSHK